MQLTFTKCEKKLTTEDILKVEQRLQVTLPDDFREHYLKFNGGVPNNSLWLDKLSAVSYKKIHSFFPMCYNKATFDDASFTLEGNTERERNDSELSRDLIPFATDWRGHIFCINHRSGEVFYFLCSYLNNPFNPEDTLLIKNTPLAPSFTDFLNMLVFDDGTLPDSYLTGE